ncbi:hypothetical protein pb186bvf_016641 [Paramecium bursaria]
MKIQSYLNFRYQFGSSINWPQRRKFHMQQFNNLLIQKEYLKTIQLNSMNYILVPGRISLEIHQRIRE